MSIANKMMDIILTDDERFIMGSVSLKIKIKKVKILSLKKLISYLCTLTSRIPRTRFIEAPQRRKCVPCTI